MKKCFIFIILLIAIVVPCKFGYGWFGECVHYDKIQWSPDSKSIIFEADYVHCGIDEASRSIFSCNIETGEYSNITPLVWDFLVSPDNKKLVFQDYYGIYELQLNAEAGPIGKPKQLIFLTQQPLVYAPIKLAGFDEGGNFIYTYEEPYEQYTEYFKCTKNNSESLGRKLPEGFRILTNQNNFQKNIENAKLTVPRPYEKFTGVTNNVAFWIEDDDTFGKSLYRGDFSTMDIGKVNLNNLPEWETISINAKRFTIQLKAGRNLEAINEDAKKYLQNGSSTRVEEWPDDIHRLRTGTFKTRSEARSALKALKSQYGVDGWIDTFNVFCRYPDDSTDGCDIPDTPETFGHITSPDNTKTCFIEIAGYAIYKRTSIWVSDNETGETKIVVHSIANF